MKKVVLMTALLCSAMLSFGQGPKVEKNDTLSYLLGVNLGEMIKSNDFPVEAIDMRVLIQGLEDALQAKLPVSDPDFESQYLYSPYLINEVFNRAIEENKTRKAAENLDPSMMTGYLYEVRKLTLEDIFDTEEIYQNFFDESITVSNWPEASNKDLSDDIANKAEKLFEIINRSKIK